MVKYSPIYLKIFGLTAPFILFQSNRVDPALAFRLAVRMETSELRGNKSCVISGFFYPKVVETSVRSEISARHSVVSICGALSILSKYLSSTVPSRDLSH